MMMVLLVVFPTPRGCAGDSMQCDAPWGMRWFFAAAGRPVDSEGGADRGREEVQERGLMPALDVLGAWLCRRVVSLGMLPVFLGWGWRRCRCSMSHALTPLVLLAIFAGWAVSALVLVGRCGGSADEVKGSIKLHRSGSSRYRSVW